MAGYFGDRTLKPGDQEFTLKMKFDRQILMKLDEELILGNRFLSPVSDVNSKCLLKLGAIIFHALKIDIIGRRHPAKGSLLCANLISASIDDPFENPHVLAKTGPQKFIRSTFPEPVYVKDLWRFSQLFAHLQPMAKVIPHVVAAERQHSHRIAADLTNGPDCRRRHFRSHRCADVNSMDPVECLKDQRHRRCTATAENDPADWHPCGIINIRIQSRIILHWRTKPAVRMRRLLSTSPWPALPVDKALRRFIVLSLPPDI